MTIKILAACDRNGGIAQKTENSELLIPWTLQRDRDFFKQEIFGKALLLGKNTYIDMGNSISLCKEAIVISGSRSNYCSYESGARYAKNKFKELIICGGERIYFEAILNADEVLLSYIDEIFPNMARFFPLEYLYKNYKLVEEHSFFADMCNTFDFTIKKFVRLKACN